MNHHDTLEHRLREGLHDLADHYEPSPLPRDLWERGRAPRERAWRPDVVAAAVVLIALLVSVVALARPGQLLAPADAPRGGALPTEVWVPDHNDVETDGPTDLTTAGRTSVAALLDDGVALLVSAEDGAHRLRTLADLDTRLVGSTGASEGGATMSLSPDGTRLAWTYRLDDLSDRSAIDTGLHIHDLLTGGTVRVKLTSGSKSRLPVGIAALQWSDNSDHVAWAGQEFEPAEGVTNAPFRVGIVDAESGEPVTWEMPTNEFVTVVSATDDGGIVVADQTTLWTTPDRMAARPLSRDQGQPLPKWVDNFESQSSPVSPSGVLAVGAVDESDEYVTADIDLAADELDRVTRSWDFTDRTAVNPLGWTPDGALLASGQQMDPEVRRSPVAGDGDELLTQFRGENTVRTLSVASDLGDASTVEFAPPPWGPKPSPWLVGALLSAALAVGLWIVSRLRRTRGHPAASLRSSGGHSGISSWATAVALSAVVVGIPVLVLRGTLPWVWAAAGIVVLLGLVFLRPRMTPVLRGAFRAVVLAVVLGVATQPLWSSLVPAETSDVAVLPLQAYAPPGHVRESYPSDRPTLAEAPTGPASLAFACASDRIVLVDPHDGAHRMRRLPGLESTGLLDESRPTLSPDGTRLAWVWETDPDWGDEPLLPDAGSGIAVVDLTTGQMEAVSLGLSRDDSYSFRDLVWSADGSHLGWVGLPQSGRRSASLVVGLTPSDGLTDSTLEVDGLPTFQVALAVGDDGRGHLLSGRRLWTLDSAGVQDERTVSDRRRPWSSAAVSPDGRTLAVGVNSGGENELGVTGLRTLNLDDPTSRMVLHPWSVPVDGDRVDVLGHSPTGRPVVVHGRNSPSMHDSVEREVEIFILDEEGGEARTRVDGVSSSSPVSIATGFADPAPVSFTEPRWPLGDGRKVAIGVVSIALLAQLAQLLGTWRRRRRA